MGLAVADPHRLRRRRRQIVLLLAGAAVAGIGAYKLYGFFHRFTRTLSSLSSAAADLSDVAAVISSDLRRFILSDSDHVPPSLVQLSKLSLSPSSLGALSRLAEALTIGVSRGVNRSSEGAVPLSDRVLDKCFSPAGTGFASVVAGSFARHLVSAVFPDSGAGSDPSEWVRIISSDPSKKLIIDCVQVFVGTAVTVWLDKTIHINAYEDFFAGLTKPTHDTKMKDMLVSACNGAVETFVTTSHKVLTGGKGDVKSILVIPENRKFVLDVTGRVTFETVRSFLEFVMWKVYDPVRSGVGVVKKEVVGRGMEIVHYASAKSMFVATVCITLCLHVLARARLLVPT